eukprot:scaffold363_cov331-Pavlova_lutheri.AAC.27
MAVRTFPMRACGAVRRGGSLIRAERTRRHPLRVSTRASEEGGMEIVHVEECEDGAKIIRFGTAEEARKVRMQEEQEVEAEKPAQMVETEEREGNQVQEEAVGTEGLQHEAEQVEAPTPSTVSENQVLPNEDMTSAADSQHDSMDISSLKVAELRTLAKARGITVSVATCTRDGDTSRDVHFADSSVCHVHQGYSKMKKAELLEALQGA